MENQILTSIWASSELTEEEKIMLSKRIAQEMKEAESRKEYDETYDKYTEKQKPIVKKAREQAAENKLNVEQINYNGSLKEKMEILGCLRNKNGDRQYSKAYLNSMRGSELMAMYEDNMRDMKEAMEKAKEERAKIKAEGKEIFEDYNLNETEAPEEVKKEEKSDLKELLEQHSKKNQEESKEEEEKTEEPTEEELEKIGETQLADDGKGREKPKVIKQSNDSLKKKINLKAAATVAAVGAGIAALTAIAVMAFGPYGLAVAGMAGAGIAAKKQFDKGKGR